jgi:hypothetical protein
MIMSAQKYVKNGRMGEVLSFRYVGGSHPGEKLIKATVVENDRIEGIDLLSENRDYKRYNADKIAGKPAVIAGESDILLTHEDILAAYNLPSGTPFNESVTVAKIFNPTKTVDYYGSYVIFKGTSSEKVSITARPITGEYDLKFSKGGRTLSFLVFQTGNIYANDKKLNFKDFIDKLSLWYKS